MNYSINYFHKMNKEKLKKLLDDCLKAISIDENMEIRVGLIKDILEAILE